MASWADMWHYEAYLSGAMTMNVTIGDRTIVLTDEQISLYEQLTKLQQGVALNTLRGMKPADAHRDAGGKCKDESNRYKLASEILIKPDVKIFLESLKQDPAPDIADSVMSRDQILQDLTVIANAKISDVVDFSSVGRELMDLESGELIGDQSIVHVKSMKDIKPEHLCLIKGVKQTKNGIELTLHDAMAARKQISDMCGHNAPIKRELSGPGGGPIRIADMSDDDLASELATLGLD